MKTEADLHKATLLGSNYLAPLKSRLQRSVLFILPQGDPLQNNTNLSSQDAAKDYTLKYLEEGLIQCYLKCCSFSSHIYVCKHAARRTCVYIHFIYFNKTNYLGDSDIQ